MRNKYILTASMWFFYALATLQLIAFYVVSTHFYLNYQDYIHGHERSPFQERIMAAVLLRSILHFHWIVVLFTKLHGVFLPPERGAFFIISFVSLAFAGLFSVKLYNAVSTRHTLGFLVYPVLLCSTLWSYILLIQQPFSYPYDLASLAFFTAGLYFIYTRQFLPLSLVILIGTFNRETTLFLIVIYVIDSVVDRSTPANLESRFNLLQVPWLRVLLLLLIWTSIKIFLVHSFAHNASENELRLRENWGYLGPKHWPALLNICGYLIPAIVILRSRLQPRRFASYLLVLPIWIVVMLFTGILLETRIYGELSSYAAIAAVLILEDLAERRSTVRNTYMQPT